MKLEIPKAELVQLVAKQLDHLFVLDQKGEGEILRAGVEAALERCEHCFSFTANKYYRRGGEVYFNPFHSGQYSIFLYYLSNSIFARHPAASTLADRIYYLNKAMNAVDMFYEVRLPAIFFLDHPVGSVLGRATYGDFFAFSQNCTVGQNKGVYPTLGQNVTMMARAMLIGACNVGDNVILSADCYVKDTDIPPCSIVFGVHPQLVIKRRDESYFKYP
jgi:serine O-acetyltransferase